MCVCCCFFCITGCFVTGLYLEGAAWDKEEACLMRPRPKVLIQELPILKVIPIEAHRLKLQVGMTMKRRRGRGEEKEEGGGGGGCWR